MFNLMFDSFRKAAESTLQLQQEAMRNWMIQQGSKSMGLPSASSTSPFAFPFTSTGWTGSSQTAQEKWAETMTDLLNKHKETLDAQYRAGVRTIEDAFHVAQAKDPEQFRKLTEDLWRHCFECLQSLGETQMRELQATMQKVMEAVSHAATASKH